MDVDDHHVDHGVQLARHRVAQLEALGHARSADPLDPHIGVERIAEHEGLQIVDLGAADMELGLGPDRAERLADAGPLPEFGRRDIGIFQIARVEDHLLPVDLGIADLEAGGEGEAGTGHAAAMACAAARRQSGAQAASSIRLRPPALAA